MVFMILLDFFAAAVLPSMIAFWHFHALRQWPVWHAIAFPVTALVGALLFARARPSSSSKPPSAPLPTSDAA
jgi:hypothetical protein